MRTLIALSALALLAATSVLPAAAGTCVSTRVGNQVYTNCTR